MFEINPLSVVVFAIIFSQSEGCLFTLLIVSFAVQKLLSFIRSHLFIFAFVSNILQPVHSKGDQSWVLFGRTDVEAETPILWPPDAKS